MLKRRDFEALDNGDVAQCDHCVVCDVGEPGVAEYVTKEAVEEFGGNLRDEYIYFCEDCYMMCE